MLVQLATLGTLVLKDLLGLADLALGRSHVDVILVDDGGHLGCGLALPFAQQLLFLLVLLRHLGSRHLQRRRLVE